MSFFFYKSIKIKFINIDQKFLLLISCIFFFSPTFRSLSIWPDSRLIGLLFFILATYFFLKFEKEPKLIYVFFNIFLVAVSAYLSLNFFLFSIYFFYKYYLKFKISRELFFIIILNIFLSLPALYYIFYLEIYFMFSGSTPGTEDQNTFLLQLNIFNKILIISSMIFFYFIPIILLNKYNFIKTKAELYEIFIIFIFFIICVYFFNYKEDFTGGGVFFQISNKIFGNNYLFYLISLVSIFFIYSISKKNLNNLIIFLLFLFSNPQLTIYHKYFDPFVFFLIFTLINIDLKNDFFNKKSILILYIYYFVFLAINIFK